MTDPGTDPRREARHNVGIRVTVGLLVTLLVAAAAVVIGYRLTYDMWPWSTYPGTLHACSRDFEPTENVESRAQIAAKGYHLVHHGDVPGWSNNAQVWTSDTVMGEPTEALAGGCHVVMWVRGGADAFKAYQLEGAP